MVPRFEPRSRFGGRQMTDKRKRSIKFPLVGIILLIVALVWGGIRLKENSSDIIPGETNAERTAYISGFGWKTGLTHCAVEEVRIPAVFDEAYEQYNALQLEQGFDLRKYRAHRVKKYTYEITNYDSDGTEAPAIDIYANLLVEDGNIIGADISSAQAGGIVTVLAKNS